MDRRLAGLAVATLVVLAGCSGGLVPGIGGGSGDAPDRRPAPFGNETAVSETISETDDGGDRTYVGEYGPNATGAVLLAESEDRAVLVQRALPGAETGSAVVRASEDDLRGMAREQSSDDGGPPTYLVIDAKTAGESALAVPVAAGRSPDRYRTTRTYSLRDRNETFPVVDDRFDRTLLSRLYHDDAANLSHHRLVYEADSYAVVGGLADENGSHARQSLEIGSWNSQSKNISQQLEAFRRIGRAAPINADDDARAEHLYDAHVESRVKVFQRVPGATITGRIDGAEGGRVVVALELRTDQGRTFLYTIRAEIDGNGQFSVTVPYPTDAIETDGSVAVGVEPVGEYRIYRTHPEGLKRKVATVSVPERAVQNGSTVDLGTIGDG